MLKNPFKKSSIASDYQILVNEINQLEANFKVLTDGDLRAKSRELEKRYKKEQNLNSIISEAFALTREASIRTLGLRHFDVQLIGGLVLNS
jgi:preprotein translocase subunit SecA